MSSIIQYVKLQLKQKFFATPIKSSILYLSPIILFIISWIIGSILDLEKKSEKVINLEFIYVSTVASVLYIGLIYRIAYEIICEKQKFRRQHMNTYGFGLFKFHIAWEIIYAIFTFFTSIIIIGCVHIMDLLPNINIIISFLEFYLFQLFVVYFSIFISAFFSRHPVIGGCVSVLVQMCQVISYLCDVYFYNYKNNHEKLQIHNSMTSIGNDIYEVRKAKKVGETINFSNLFNRGYVNIFIHMSISFGIIIFINLFIVFVDYFFVSIHIKKNRSDKKDKSYYEKLIENRYRNQNTDSNQITLPEAKDEFFDLSEFKHLFKVHEVVNDNDPVNVYTNNGVAISIKHLFKKYTNKITAISNVSFDIYDNEIFVIAGPKNSGKSTLMKMLYGRHPSSYGNVYYSEGGKMIEMGYRRWRTLSRNLSVAPKENYMFMEDLSVSDHIKLYQSMTETNEDGFALLKELNFLGNVSDSIKNLSEVEKTKVKIALALLKFQKYIFLEEPTSGMSEEDRQCFWKAIHARSQNRVIVISTDIMEEAVQNANHILVLRGGMIQCIGDNEYIKHRSVTKNSEHYLTIEN